MPPGGKNPLKPDEKKNIFKFFGGKTFGKGGVWEAI